MGNTKITVSFLKKCKAIKLSNVKLKIKESSEKDFEGYFIKEKFSTCS